MRRKLTPAAFSREDTEDMVDLQVLRCTEIMRVLYVYVFRIMSAYYGYVITLKSHGSLINFPCVALPGDFG